MKIWLNELSPAPPSLLPLPLQTIIAHSPYVDLIPIPALRERLLLAQHIIDCKIPLPPNPKPQALGLFSSTLYSSRICTSL